MRYHAEPDGRLVFEEPACSCGCAHHPVDKDIYVGENLLDHVPEFIARRGLGTHCVLVADDTTYRVAGERVHRALAAAGFQPGTQPELYAAPAETTLALTAGKACVCCQ